MKLTENAKAYLNRLFPDCGDTFAETDPEFAELFGNFAFDEVVSSDDLSEKTRFLAILAALIGCQGVDAFRAMLPAALNFGVTPVEAKETVYQAAAYLGIGRVYPFLRAANEVLAARGIKLPLEGQAKTKVQDRLAAASGRRSPSSARGCAALRKRGRRTDLSTNGWSTTVSATITPAAGWTCAAAR